MFVTVVLATSFAWTIREDLDAGYCSIHTPEAETNGGVCQQHLLRNKLQAEANEPNLVPLSFATVNSGTSSCWFSESRYKGCCFRSDHTTGKWYNYQYSHHGSEIVIRICAYKEVPPH